MLQIDDLHAGVGGTEILRGVTLELKAGEVHAVMGPRVGQEHLANVLAGPRPTR